MNKPTSILKYVSWEINIKQLIVINFNKQTKNQKNSISTTFVVLPFDLILIMTIEIFIEFTRGDIEQCTVKHWTQFYPSTVVQLFSFDDRNCVVHSRMSQSTCHQQTNGKQKNGSVERTFNFRRFEHDSSIYFCLPLLSYSFAFSFFYGKPWSCFLYFLSVDSNVCVYCVG